MMKLGALLLAAAASAQYTIDSLSFGHKGPLNAAGGEIPGWTISGNDFAPQVLSDRIILTPPAPGNKRGGIFAKHDLVPSEWKAELEFRASGQERGSGVLNLWYAKQLPEHLPSIYTVGAFDGLVLSVDQYGGSGGTIRGFLNDGSLNFRTHHNIDEMAFGNCHYSYRNRGELSRLTVEQKSSGFEVTIDGNPCFKSDKIRLPSQYYFGISAASAENPDSFEIGKFLVLTQSSVTREEHRSDGYEPPKNFQNEQAYAQQGQQSPPAPQAAASGGSPDLNGIINRIDNLQATVNQLASTLNALDIQRTVGNLAATLKQLDERHDVRHSEVMARGGGGASDSILDALARRTQNIETAVQKIQKDIEGRDLQKTLADLQRALHDTQANLMTGMTQAVTGSAPKMGLFIAVVLAFQVMLAGAYFVYKKRRANAPKKFL